MTREKHLQIRDPIHGTLQLTRAEAALVDHPAFQRLRLIKQLGVADFAFPGATHTRYAHGLGTMHVASKMFDALRRDFDLEATEARRLQQSLRIAALFHDLGHAPLSHTTERFMPAVQALDLGPWRFGDVDRRATHEDYTLAIVARSSLADLIRGRFSEAGVTPEDVATLIAGVAPNEAQAARFRVGGRDWLPLLAQCVSSELDADRMDYLLRDSYFAGVPYGRYDHEWILDNLVPVERDGVLNLGLAARASFGFEDYLLSRYHMFLSVYLNHIPIGYEAMLERFHLRDGRDFSLPADLEAYLGCDDPYLITVLRSSDSEWAQRIVKRRAFRLVLEVREGSGERSVVSGPVEHRGALPDVVEVCDAIRAAGIDALTYDVSGRLSKYFTSASQPPTRDRAPELSIVEAGHPVPVEAYVPLYRRYAGAIHLRRVYAEPDRLEEAREVVRGLPAPHGAREGP